MRRQFHLGAPLTSDVLLSSLLTLMPPTTCGTTTPPSRRTTLHPPNMSFLPTIPKLQLLVLDRSRFYLMAMYVDSRTSSTFLPFMFLSTRSGHTVACTVVVSLAIISASRSTSLALLLLLRTALTPTSTNHHWAEPLPSHTSSVNLGVHHLPHGLLPPTNHLPRLSLFHYPHQNWIQHLVILANMTTTSLLWWHRLSIILLSHRRLLHLHFNRLLILYPHRFLTQGHQRPSSHLNGSLLPPLTPSFLLGLWVLLQSVPVTLPMDPILPDISPLIKYTPCLVTVASAIISSSAMRPRIPSLSTAVTLLQLSANMPLLLNASVVTHYHDPPRLMLRCTSILSLVMVSVG